MVAGGVHEHGAPMNFEARHRPCCYADYPYGKYSPEQRQQHKDIFVASYLKDEISNAEASYSSYLISRISHILYISDCEIPSMEYLTF